MAKAWVSYILYSIADTRVSESTKSLLHILAGLSQVLLSFYKVRYISCYLDLCTFILLSLGSVPNPT